MPCAPVISRTVWCRSSVRSDRIELKRISRVRVMRNMYFYFSRFQQQYARHLHLGPTGATAARIVLSHDFSLVSPRHKTTFDVDARSSSWKAPASITAGGRAHPMAATQSSGIRSSAVRMTWAPLPRRRTAAFPVLHRWQVADTRRCVPLPRHHIHLCLHASGIHTHKPHSYGCTRRLPFCGRREPAATHHTLCTEDERAPEHNSPNTHRPGQTFARVTTAHPSSRRSHTCSWLMHARAFSP